MTGRFVVVGGGIAGVSAAAHLAPHGDVVLLEMEDSLAFHTTGRSAALFVVNYGADGVRPLARASKSFLESPPDGATDAPVLSERGLLWIATAAQMPELEEIVAAGRRSGVPSELIDAKEVAGLLPVVNVERIVGGVYEQETFDIDVAGLHQAFVRIARNYGASIRIGEKVVDLSPSGSGWKVRTASSTFHADVVVNASGAWGDQVAAMAGVDPVGLQPLRRTAFMVPGDDSYSRWPMVIDAGEGFYFKPDGVQILCSLSEKVPSEPTDPRPRMEDVALAIDRINQATTLGIRTVNSEWVGLRTFAPDKEMVIGEEPGTPGFFWLVGQGGTGILTSPAYGSLLASQVLGSDLPAELVEAGVDPEVMSPARFR